MDQTELWQKTLKQLQGQMTRATFQQWFASSSVVGLEGDRLTVHVSGDGALDQASRYTRIIERTLAAVGGTPISLALVNGSGPSSNPARPAREAEPSPAAADLAAFDFTRDQWVKHPRYLSLFYQPYLASFGRFTNRAFGVWQFVRDSFDLKNLAAPWSPIYRTSLHDLAAATGCTPHQLAGVWAFCPTFSRCLEETGEAIACCGRYQQMGRRDWPAPATEAHPEGRPVCRYWKAGIFQLWAEHGLAVIKQAGTSTRTTFYQIQICRWPLLLTPRQVARLPEAIRQAHAEFLRDVLKVDLDQWQAIEQITLAAGRLDLSGLEIADEAGTLSLYRLNQVFFCAPIEFKQTQSGGE